MTRETARAAVGGGDRNIIELDEIDDYLGDAQQRFFGSGYRRPTYRVHSVIDDQVLAATVDVSYPSDWSRKKTGLDLRPHLSTVDVMILGVRSAEALLAARFDLTPEQVNAASIHKLSVRAGTRPEESLIGLPLQAHIKKTQPAQTAEQGKVESTVTAQVGVMKISVVFRHDATSNPASRLMDHAFLNEDPNRHWGAGYRLDRQQITSVTADTRELSAQAVVTLHHGNLDSTRSSHAPGDETFIDAFVSLLQLGQVLMYELDQLDRAHSDTLWMQQLVLRPVPQTGDGRSGKMAWVPAKLRIADHQLLDLPTGRWRNVDFRGRAGGIEMSAAFAHRLPYQEGNAR